MKIKSCFIISLFYCLPLYALIIETDNFDVIIQQANSDTLVIFDIDNTIARPYTALGSDEWFCYLVDQKIAQGYDYISAIYAVLPLVYYVQFHVPLMLTDPVLPSLFSHLQETGINTMAITSRSLYLAERTHKQLKDIGITFTLKNCLIDEYIFPLLHPCLYKYAMIFCGNNNKGDILLTFLDLINYLPKKIIFIDDKMSHVKAVESALSSTNIEYIGIRYTGCDHYIHNFDPAKAQEQWDAIKVHNIVS